MSEVFDDIELEKVCKCDKPNIGIVGFKKGHTISVPIYHFYNCGAQFVSGDRKWKELADKCKEN